MASVFTSSLRLCATAGMVHLGVVAVDGTKMGCPAAERITHTGSDEFIAHRRA
jgi:hypothetical protein